MDHRLSSNQEFRHCPAMYNRSVTCKVRQVQVCTSPSLSSSVTQVNLIESQKGKTKQNKTNFHLSTIFVAQWALSKYCASYLHYSQR